jgi:hypothetical protein
MPILVDDTACPDPHLMGLILRIEIYRQPQINLRPQSYGNSEL